MPRDPIPPRALREVERVMRHGDDKYPPGNYLRERAIKHFHSSRLHQNEWIDGGNADAESGLHPLAHAVARLLMALEVELARGEES